jgi:hypothetical protein
VAITVSAAQLAQTTYQVGGAADQLYVQASDGTLWSGWQGFVVVPGPNRAPVVTAPNATLTHNQSVAASSLFTASDPDGDAIAGYQFYDATGNGHFVVNGVAQAAGVAITVTAAQLAQTSYQSGSGADQLYVQASDGTLWSGWQGFVATAPVDRAPVVTPSSQTLTYGQTVSASSLFTVSDPDGDPITSYQFYDATGSGHFVVNGVAQAAGVAITVPAAQLAQTSYQVGGAADQLYVQASDGTLWSGWQGFVVSPQHLTINLVYDAQALAAPQSFRDGMQAAANIIQAAFLDPITVNIVVGYGEFGGTAISPNISEGDIGYTGFGVQFDSGQGVGVSYANLRTDLANSASDNFDQLSVNSLPQGTSLEGKSSFILASAQAKALGLLSDQNAAIDGQVGMGTGFTGNVLIAGALHELTHAMGRIAGQALGNGNVIGTIAMDLFRYNENRSGSHVFDSGIPATPAYFSLDGGLTDTADFGIHSDPGDFLNSGVQGSTDPFDEFVSSSVSTALTAADLKLMDVLGYTLSQSAESAIGGTPFRSGLQAGIQPTNAASADGNIGVLSQYAASFTSPSQAGLATQAAPDPLQPFSDVLVAPPHA